MKIVVLMLTSGHEVMGNLLSDDDRDDNLYLEFPQAVRWWRDKEQGHCYEFVPFCYGANMQIKVPINKFHIVTMADANEDISKAYRGLIDQITGHAERMAGLKRQMDERDDAGLEIIPDKKK